VHFESELFQVSCFADPDNKRCYELAEQAAKSHRVVKSPRTGGRRAGRDREVRAVDPDIAFEDLPF
jgi:hypothetical protein